MNFNFSKLKLGINVRDFILILIFSLISIIFNFGAFGMDSAQYIFLSFHFINQYPVEFLFVIRHIGVLMAIIRLVRPLVPFLAGWLNNIIYLGNVPGRSILSGYWQLPFGLVNAIFFFLSCIILYKLIFKVTNSNSEKAVIAVLLYCFSSVMFYNTMILLEGTILFFTIFLVYLIICKPFDESYINSIILGIAIGLAGLTRETLLISGVILFVGYLIYRIKDIFTISNLKKLLIVGAIALAIFGGYVLLLGFDVYLDCLNIFYSINFYYSSYTFFLIPQTFFSKLTNTLADIGIEIIQFFRYLLIFFVIGIINLFYSDISKNKKILLALSLLSFFFPMIFSPFILDRFVFPLYIVSMYFCVDGIYFVEERRIWTYSAAISISILNLIFVIFFYPYTFGDQILETQPRMFLYYLFFIYLGAVIALLFNKYRLSRQEQNI